MPLAASTTQTKIRSLKWIIFVGLLSGILVTTLIWLKIPKQLILPVYGLCLVFTGVIGFLHLRRKTTHPRWIIVLSAIAAVSLVYLFPQLFRPVCGDVPRAFAAPFARCGTCLDHVCEWSNKTHDWHCYCDEWDNTGCDPNELPVITAALSCNNWGANKWCLGSLSIDLQATEPLGREVLISGKVNGAPFACPAGNGSVSCSIPLPEGTGTVKYKAISITELSVSGSLNYKHDSLQPQIDGSLNGTNGENGWFVSAVDVIASASDPKPGSGVATFKHNLNGAGWENFPGSLSLSDGTYSLSLKAKDAAGNIIKTDQTILVDSVTPTLDLNITGTAGANDWYTSNVQVAATASDSGSGVRDFEYDLDGAGWAAYITPQGDATPLELTDGIHSLNLRVIDEAGNITEGLHTFQVDTVTPTLDLNVTGMMGAGGWYTSNIQVAATTSDSGSGVNTLEFNLDGAGWTSYAAPLDLADGVHTLSLRVVDNAGNTTEGMQTFQVDTLAPEIDLSLTGTKGTNSWYISIVQMEAVARDTVSNLSNLETRIDGGDWHAYTAPLVFGDGLHSYRFRAWDNAGNLVKTPLQEIWVDTIPPAISLPESWELGEVAPFELQDNGSGLASVRLVIEDEDERYPKVTWDEILGTHNFKGQVEWDGRFKDGTLALPGGEYYATLKVSDNAGNEGRLAGRVIVPIGGFVEKVFHPLDGQGSGPVSGVEASELIAPPTPLPSTISEMPVSQFLMFDSPSTFSFGGEGNNGAVPATQSAVSVGGVNNSVQPSNTQAGNVAFNTGASTPTQANTQNNNILWGATATAAIGAFIAEAVRRKEAEEAEKAAMRARSAERQERRATSNYSQQIKANKLAQLEAKWMQIEQEAQALKQAQKQAMISNLLTRKEETLEPIIPPEVKKSSYVAPDMSWKRNDYAQLDHAEKVAEASKPSKEKSWWDKTVDWIDNHQAEISLGVGVAVGLAAIALSGGAATPLVAAAWMAGAATVAGGAVAGGTVLLNNHYGRSPGENIWRNIGLAAGGAAITSGLGFLLAGGGIQAGIYKVGNTITNLCVRYPTTCSRAGSAFTLWDTVETIGLRAKLAVQTFQGNPAAAETALELQMEQVDGGMPGNTTAKVIKEELSELATRHQYDAQRILTQGSISSGKLEDYVPNEFIDEVISGFDGGRPQAVTLKEDLSVYRYWSDSNRQNGRWVTLDPNLSPEEARILLALPKDNFAFGKTEFIIRKDTTVFTGAVANQATSLDWAGPYAIGNGFQIFIPDPSVLQKVPSQ